MTKEKKKRTGLRVIIHIDLMGSEPGRQIIQCHINILTVVDMPVRVDVGGQHRKWLSRRMCLRQHHVPRRGLQFKGRFNAVALLLLFRRGRRPAKGGIHIDKSGIRLGIDPALRRQQPEVAVTLGGSEAMPPGLNADIIAQPGI